MEIMDAREMSTKELFEALKERKKCTDCIECGLYYIENPESKGNRLNCSSAIVRIAFVLEERFKALEEKSYENCTSSTEEIPSFYQSTRSFMKRRGYKHCYMCGSEL